MFKWLNKLLTPDISKMSDKPSDNPIIVLSTELMVLQVKVSELEKRLDRIDPLGLTKSKK